MFEGIVLGKKIGKPEFVSGKTAYIQKYEGGDICVSYWTPVGAKVGGVNYRTTQRYSVTTSKHMSRYGLTGNTADTNEAALRKLWDTGER